MRSLLKLAVLLLAVSAGQPANAQNGARPAPPKASVPRAAAIPDYGGRDSGPLVPMSSAPVAASSDTAVGAAALNPLAQAGRALEALVVVLALVVGGLALLKRSGLLSAEGGQAAASFVPGAVAGRLFRLRGPQPSPAPSAAVKPDMMTLLGSQTLPHAPGAGLHVVSVAGRTLLLGATAQSVTLLAELDADWEPDIDAAPSAFADHLRQADPVAATADRLQALLARSRANGDL